MCIGLVALSLSALLSAAEVSAELHASTGALLVEDSPFERAVQLHTGLDTVLRLAFGADARKTGHDRASDSLDAVALFVGIGVGSHLPSRPDSAGIVYRGLTIRSVLAGVERPIRRWLSAEVSVRAAVANYRFTSVLIGYPELSVGPTFIVSSGPTTRIRWHAYVARQFRTDVDYAYAAGVRAAIVASQSGDRVRRDD
ncbi:MAG: hypothetical protein EA382_09900 [Spirochaetaceae bacterium]|nr:MAG: hypothetical protein EA382_09900 [Spirochaetaceae bacterium]